MSFSHGLDCVLFVVVDFVEVCHDVLERLSWSSDGLEHFLIVLDTKGTHEENHGDSGCSSSADLDHEHTVTSLLDVEWLAHTVLLRENLSNFGSLSVSLVDFNSDTVWCEVFHGDENTLGTVDDEVASRIQRVFALLAKEVVPQCGVFCGCCWVELSVACNVASVQVASLRTDHDWHATDLHCLFLWRADAVSEDLEVDGNG